MAIAAGVLVLCFLALPTLGGFRSMGDQELCVANFRQLTRAWLIYAEDHAGRLPGNLDGGDAMAASSTNRNWVAGWLDFNGSPANTNVAFLRDAQLGRYLDTMSVFRCPADISMSRGRTGEARVRSVSMNGYVGQRSTTWTPGYLLFTNLSSIVDPSPSGCLVFVDEREDSLNDGTFLIDMTAFDPPQTSRTTVVDFPAARHDGGATMSFADGHAETWRWQDARTRPSLRPGQILSLNVNQPNNPDIVRLQRAASRRIATLR